MSEMEYFASKEAEKTAATLLHKANAWYNQVYTNGYLLKVRDSWMAYHGAHYSTTMGSHRISFGGEQGELVQLAINHYGNIASHMLQMITANRPAFQARATNTDNKSQAQAKLANNLLDYYMREKRLEKYLIRAVEYAIVLGTGYIKMEWNATTGEVYDINEETGVEIREGDVEFTNLSPYDVVFDTSKETTENHDWVVCRSFKNKFDLAAKFPELSNRIKGMSTKSDLLKFKFEMFAYDDTDDIPVYEFYHRKTESMPNGRYLLFLDSDIILMDTPMPYRALPVYRIAPRDILGTPYGYTPMFDLLPIQDAVNSLYSTILTNQHAFGVQNIYVPRGADISLKSLEGGLNIVEGAQGLKPEALNLTATPPEVFKFVQMLESQMETLSGINSVARGNPEASLKSGSALALVQSMALQFISGLQQQYVQLIEDIGTGLINTLKDFAAVPRIAMIAGKRNKTFVEQEFSGDDLSQVNRVIVDMGNPISKTTAGKMQMATELIQYGDATPQQYVSVMTTGQLDVATDDIMDETLTIAKENERLAEGLPVRAFALDQHMQHIKGHRSVISDYDVRMNDELSAALYAHIQEHVELLRQTDPGLLSAIGEQPLGPVNGTPPNPQQTAQPPPNEAPAPGEGPMNPQEGTPPVPNMPNMPQVDGQLLPNPELQQAAMGNVKQGQ